ncbi:ATP-dependent DNA helicase RecG [Corynebacterium uropygiale]|uniref:Probable DNA 3'-5' helicase RecG n=1 Tax=Corynebacterium uropygiale TaxID=1775911 RepID=A0A9X1QPM2_9CORY|nr:ATP-dependent DNA helicase RecG [Corynebacterium uropygiale]MCF4007029.1 ATP-dependent DNA helicase RecG [Corynebacterium uropygiale]
MLGWQDERALGEVLPEKEARALTQHLGLSTVSELLEYYPRSYSRHGDMTSLAAAQEGDTISFLGEVSHARVVHAGKKSRLTLRVRNGAESIAVTFFHSPYAARLLTDGTQVMLTGKLSFFRDAPQLTQPNFFVIAPGPGSAAHGGEGTGILKAMAAYPGHSLDTTLLERDYLPIYPATARLASWRILAAIHHVLEGLPPIPEPLNPPPSDLPGLDDALRGIHEPGPEGPRAARERLKYNEALGLALVMAVRRADHERRPAPACPGAAPGADSSVETLQSHLPFELTEGQRAVCAEIMADLSRDTPMSRLLQGDVGSGKTVVALLAMLQVVDSGRQCALLAPTEVLAAQHARSLMGLIGRAGLGTSVVTLSGSMGTAAKREALLAIMSGQADIVVGTHALIQDSVEFFDVGLVVVDEQHRFGVEQRDQLRTQGRDGLVPHQLVMTATPIPRTIAMTVFGDLSVSVLWELPGGRRPIQTTVVPVERQVWMARVDERIREEVQRGHQVYIVCPRIENEGGVLDYYSQVTAPGGAFADLRVELLHGRMSGEEKDAAMARFSKGEADILVATTVIEVGVDVPNATMMVIREAENFGISQLHQLRGRVGRGSEDSLCLLLTSAEVGTPAHERLVAVQSTTDGFRLAEEDLSHREEGDVLGTRQSGHTRSLKLISVVDDGDLIARAHEDAAAFVRADPAAAARLAGQLDDVDYGYLDKS